MNTNIGSDLEVSIREGGESESKRRKSGKTHGGGGAKSGRKMRGK